MAKLTANGARETVFSPRVSGRGKFYERHMSRPERVTITTGGRPAAYLFIYDKRARYESKTFPRPRKRIRVE